MRGVRALALVVLAVAGLVLLTAATTTSTTTTTTTTTSTTTTSTSTTTTTTPTTSTTTPTTTTTTATAVGSSSSFPWGLLVLAVALVAGAIALITFAVRRRGRDRAELAWRRDTIGALDGARLARDLLPASGRDIPDVDRWQSVRDRVEQAAQALDRAGTVAPIADGATVARSTAAALRNLVFALEADRLLRDGTRAPTPDQLAQADATCRSRTAELDDGLARLDRLVRPAPGPGGSPPNA
jgi:hypothetical protein